MDSMRPNGGRDFSRVMMIITIIALIRIILEPFRLHHYSTTPINYERIRVFLLGALVSSISLFLMIILGFFSRYRLIIWTAVVNLAVLLALKFLIPF